MFHQLKSSLVRTGVDLVKWLTHTDGQWKLQCVEVMEKGSVNRLNHVISTNLEMSEPRK